MLSSRALNSPRNDENVFLLNNHVSMWLCFVMKEYDLIVIGTGSAMEVADAMIRDKPDMHVAVIDKDEPGGICLTRGCIPSKLLIYPADIARTIQQSDEFGIHTEIAKIDFQAIMQRMRTIIHRDINNIRNGLTTSKNIDYYNSQAEFTAPYTLKAREETITSKMILLSTGSKPLIPPIEGLKEAGYLTSDTFLNLNHLPKSVAFIGGGYIAAEYGYFLSAMGTNVTIIEMAPRYLPIEEPEISAVAAHKMQKHAVVIINHVVRKVQAVPEGKKLTAENRDDKTEKEVIVKEIFVATGRGPNTDILHPEKAGIKTDQKGYIIVDEHMQTSQLGIYAIGDANGKFLFKHVANHEAKVVYYNVALKKKIKVNYHAVPHAVFTDPEIASVALREEEAIEKYGKDNVLIGFYRYEDTAKGEAMARKDEFVKVIVTQNTGKILGAHIIGAQASVLIQEIVNLMYTQDQSSEPLTEAMHIHPAMSEVVARAFSNLMTPEQYHHFLKEHSNLPL